MLYRAGISRHTQSIQINVIGENVKKKEKCKTVHRKIAIQNFIDICNHHSSKLLTT